MNDTRRKCFDRAASPVIGAGVLAAPALQLDIQATSRTAPADRDPGAAHSRHSGALPNVDDLSRSLLTSAQKGEQIDCPLFRFCAELCRRGLLLWRATLGRDILHPEISGSSVVWSEQAKDRYLSKVNRPTGLFR